MDLKQEAHIHELKARGLGVREISRQVGVSASTVSRTLSREPGREQILDLISRVEMLEKKMTLLQEALSIMHDPLARAGTRYTHRMVDLFQRWPDDYFKKLHFAGKL